MKTKERNSVPNVMTLRNRESFYYLSPLTADLKIKPLNEAYSNKTKSKDDAIKETIRAQMRKFLKASKSNYELLNFVLRPKIRILTPLKQKTPARLNSNSSFKPSFEQRPKHVKRILLSRQNVKATLPPSAWNPNLMNDANRLINPVGRINPVDVYYAPDVKLTGIVNAQPSLRRASHTYFDVPGEESSDRFYDLDSSSPRS